MIISGLDMTSVTEAIKSDLPFGIWCADFNKHIVTGYNHYDKLLNINKQVLNFSEFVNLIREDYRYIIHNDLNDIQKNSIYEIDFPTNERWLKAKMTHIDNENQKAYGYIVEYYGVKEQKKDEENIANKLYTKQNQIINRIFDKMHHDKYEGITSELLDDLREAINADRTSVIEYNTINKTLSCTYESTKYGIEPRLDILKNISIDTIEWIDNNMQQNETMYIYDIDNLPHEKHIQVEILCTYKVKTMIIHPLHYKEKIIGFVIIDFLTHTYKPSISETDWIKALTRFVEYSINIYNKEKNNISEKERLNILVNTTPFGHIHLRFTYNEKNEPNDMVILTTNQQFNKSINCQDIKGKLISEIFEKEAKHIFNICNSIAHKDKKEEIVDDFIYYNGEKLAANIIMPNYNEFICITTPNLQLLYAFYNDQIFQNQQLSRNIQHEIRTRLNAILGFLELFNTETDENNKTKYMEIIKENAQSILDSSLMQDPENPSNTEAPQSTTDEGNTQKKRIMIAEDTESNYMLVSYILKNKYDIIWAHDGVEAIEMYEQEKPDLILMDVRMPRLGGLSATSKIRETNKEIPIIALTAFAFESDRAKTIEAGCTDFMAKPIKGALLKEMVAKYLK